MKPRSPAWSRIERQFHDWPISMHPTPPCMPSPDSSANSRPNLPQFRAGMLVKRLECRSCLFASCSLCGASLHAAKVALFNPVERMKSATFGKGVDSSCGSPVPSIALVPLSRTSDANGGPHRKGSIPPSSKIRNTPTVEALLYGEQQGSRHFGCTKGDI